MNEDHHLDAVDRRILASLQADASLSHAALAQTVGASPASCWRRVRALQESGVLRNSVYLVNPDKVRRGVNVLCNLRMKSHAEEERASFERFVQGRSEVLECYSMSGEWDYLLRIAVADVGDYERFLMRTLLAHPTVANASSHFALDQVKYTTALPV